MTEAAPPAVPTFLCVDGMKPHVGDTFQLHLGADDGDPLGIELVDVGAVGGHSQRADGTAFALLFRGPKDCAIEQQIYRLEHDSLGTFDLFLVCVGPDPDDHQMRYEAVFT